MGSDFGGGVIDLNQMTRRDDFLIQNKLHKSGEVTTKSSVREKFSSEKSYPLRGKFNEGITRFFY